MDERQVMCVCAFFSSSISKKKKKQLEGCSKLQLDYPGLYQVPTLLAMKMVCQII